MKRLKKKAWDTIDLFHHTSSQLFMKMMEEGYITPGGYNNKVSGGGHTKIWDISDGESQSEQYELILIDRFRNSVSDTFIITQRLLDYVDKRKEENPDGWTDEKIDVSSTTPSGNENGVYLTKDYKDEYEYAYEAVRNNNDASLPNFSVSLKISVQTDALSPDADDLEYFKADLPLDDKKPLWKQSLDSIGQVLHNGPIDVSSINGVLIKDSGYSTGNSINGWNDFLNYVDGKVELDQWISANEAYSQLQALNNEYLNIDNLQTASVKTRLLKQIKGN